ncbi:jg27343, partial [Pararge aegeria aegeria]
VNRDKNHLTSNIAKKILEPDHCDLYLIHSKQEDIKVELKIAENKPILKCLDKNVITENVVEPKKEALIDIKSDDEFLNDDIDNDSDFLYSDSKVKGIKSDKDNSDEFMNDKYDLADDTDNDWDFLKDSDSEIEIVDVGKKKGEAKNGKNARSKTVRTTKRNSTVKKEKPPPKPRNTVKKEANKKVRVRVKKEAKKPAKPENLDYLKQFLVTKLSHEEQLADIQKRKESDNFKNSPYKCMKCFKGFCNVTTYNTHMEKHTNKFGQFECNVCGIHIKSNYRLRHHVIKNHSMRYSCYSCPLVTNHK